MTGARLDDLVAAWSRSSRSTKNRRDVTPSRSSATDGGRAGRSGRPANGLTMDRSTQAAPGSPVYLRDVLGRACRERLPVSGAFDLTYRCNFRCVHCYGGHLAAQPRSRSGELETAQVIDLLSGAAGAGCLLLLLSGGEPLLRDDFVQIYTAARRLGLIVTVFTNASLVTQAHLDAFSEYPPSLVEVSVYGATETTYERITGVPGSFRRVTARPGALAGRWHPRGPEDDDPAGERGGDRSHRGVSPDLGLRFRVDPLVTPRLNGDLAPLEQRVDPQRAVDIELGAAERRMEMTKFFRQQRAAGTPGPEATGRLYCCGAGVASFHVDPRGFMHPCLLSLGIAYNAGTLGFAEAWKAVTTATDRVSWDGAGGCVDCPTIDLCGYCPGLFALEQASPSQPPEYMCRLGESRLRAVCVEEPEVAGVRTS